MGTSEQRPVVGILVGGGPALEEMKALAKTLGVQDYVTFTGRASDHDLFEMLNTADVSVFSPDNRRITSEARLWRFLVRKVLSKNRSGF